MHQIIDRITYFRHSKLVYITLQRSHLTISLSFIDYLCLIMFFSFRCNEIKTDVDAKFYTSKILNCKRYVVILI